MFFYDYFCFIFKNIQKITIKLDEDEHDRIRREG